MPPTPPPTCDVLIVGGGPAGAACAAVCARAGLRTVVVERAVFPRDKVCGDCLNPECWPVFERLGVADAVRRLPHVRLRAVEFVGLRGRAIRLPLPDDPARGEIAVKRRDLDALLLDHAAALGASVHQGRALHAVDTVSRPPLLDGSEATIIDATGGGRPPEKIAARFLVAADGRNSVTARLTAMLPRNTGTGRDAQGRIGLQAHVPCPPDFGPTVQMRWFADGYGGLCPVGNGELNISLAAPPRALERLKRWAHAEFSLPDDYSWRTIAPLDRAPAPDAASRVGNVYLVGDAARVVEPFTGEGIYYALRSGELAAQSIIAAARIASNRPDPALTTEQSADAIAANLLSDTGTAHFVQEYCQAHTAMYRGRLWVNRLARAAGRHPRAASWALGVLRWQPGLLRYLTAKVVG